MNKEKFTTVTYNFANGAKVASPISKDCFYDIKGRKRTEEQLHKLFQETAWDKGAVSYTVDADTSEEIENVKEIHFSAVDRKLAKAQYADFKKSNPNGFNQSLKEFQRYFVKSLNSKKRLGMNVSNIILQ